VLRLLQHGKGNWVESRMESRMAASTMTYPHYLPPMHQICQRSKNLPADKGLPDISSRKGRGFVIIPHELIAMDEEEEEQI
jgi:hypothetical protein